MKLGDLVRIRHRTLTNGGEFGQPAKFEEVWEEGGIVVKEYHTWEKIVSVFHKGEVRRIPARDVQLVKRVKRVKE